MSMYVKAGSLMTNPGCLIKALMQAGPWREDQIEFHTEPQTLIDWHGQPRPEKADIIIRRQHLSGGSNDIGFVKNEQGQYESIISVFDAGYRWGQEWQTQMTNYYNEEVVIQTCEQNGFSWQAEEHEGVRHIVAYVYE